jgi:metal-sulfur cluster biosynthetic enzyme
MEKYYSPTGKLIEKRFVDRLRKVFDPEIKESVLDIGLIYSVREEGVIHVTMSLTTPLCPFADLIIMDIKNALNELDKLVSIDVVFDPIWTPKMMSERLRDKLGLDEEGKPI